MELSNFHFWISVFTDICFLFPILFGLLNWKLLFKQQKIIIYYLTGNFIISLISYLYYLYHISAHFWGNLYTINEVIFLFPILNYFTNKKYLVIINFLKPICISIVLIELFFINNFENKENVYSGTFLKLIFFILFLKYFLYTLKTDFKSSTWEKDFNQLVSFGLLLLFFFQAIWTFLMKFLLETETNYYLYLQIENFMCLFKVISIGIISYAFYKTKFQLIMQK